MNDALEPEVEDLREDNEVDVKPDADQKDQFTQVIIRDWSIPNDAYNQAETDVMIRVPDGYPNTPPDWIHVEESLRLEGGGQLRNAKPNRVQDWLALSYHPGDTQDDFEWTPYENDLRWYVEVLTAMRFRQED